MEYNFKNIEAKWQKVWDNTNRFSVKNKEEGKENKYVLAEFPYPSGKGLHLGHIFTFTAPDILARLLRLKGYNVIFPYGLDAFGLEAERTAIKQKITPQEVVAKNKAIFKEQVKLMGYSFDWDREIDTSDPQYYKWTQWLFLQFFKMGQAYKGNANVNFCPNCGVLANEEVEEGKCCQCAAETYQKEKAQWLFKITDYAERLINDLEHTGYLPYVKTSQINYIGKSSGVNVLFKTNVNVNFEIFTTCIETIYGITFMVLAPDGKIVNELKPHIKNWNEVQQYIKMTGQKTDMERTSLNKDKTGVELKGIFAVNPVNNKQVPVFISDFVLGGYGTGAVMAVPSHDQRDYEFAEKFGLEYIQVIEGDVSKEAVEKGTYLSKNSKLLNSAEFTGLTVADAKKAITKKLIKMKIAKETVNYQLHDWIFARQRYWGEPIPVINCPKCGLVAVPEKELPLTLPKVTNYEMNKEGESPLAEIAEFVNCTCPKCKGKAKRETDTMPGWAGSSWYFYRYLDAKNSKEFVSKDALNAFPVVDYYFGGNEHTTRHLLYARYWTKMLYDLGLVLKDEFCDKRYSHGLILGTDGTKMSKSRGNVVDPRDMITKYGTDALRIGIMFIGDYQATFPFNESAVMAANKFLSRSLSLLDNLTEGREVRKELSYAINFAIKKVDEDIVNIKYNTAISALMTLLNEFKKQDKINKKELEIYLTLLAPFAPHLAEEMWVLAGLGKDMKNSSWTNYDEKALVLDEINIPVQINGKLRTTLVVSRNIEEVELINLAKEKLNLVAIKKVIYVPAKILNLIV